MNVQELQAYLHEHIPLSAAMQVKVLQASERKVCLQAPLAANINHRDTVFGGSAASVAILAAWTLLYVRFKEEKLPARLVIQHCDVDYTLPIEGDFQAVCEFISEAQWQKARKLFQRRGKTRIQLESCLQINGETLTTMHGDFVALAME